MVGKVTVERTERLRRLCKSIVAGDGGTRAELQSAVLKYAATQYVDTTQALKNLYRDETELGHLVRKAVEIVDDDDAEDNHRDDDDRDERDDDDATSDHRVSQLADLLIEAERFSTRAEALNWLLRHPNGHALVRTHKAEKEHPTMSSIESLENIVKAHGVAGVVQIAKNIVEEGKSFRITEEEFVNLIDTAARVAHPELGAAAFEKVYERNPVLAKAIAVIKAALFTVELGPGYQPQVVGGSDVNPDHPKAARDAYARLQEIGKQRWPTASEATQFANAFEAHPELARVAHKRPRATTHYEFPR